MDALLVAEDLLMLYQGSPGSRSIPVMCLHALGGTACVPVLLENCVESEGFLCPPHSPDMSTKYCNTEML